MNKSYDYIVVGAGLAGACAARILADRKYRVLVLEKLPHIGGSIYDCFDEAGILVHKYGPHIFHTNDREVYDFLCRFTEFNGYVHRVVAKLSDCEVPVPFNFRSLENVYGKEKASHLVSLLYSSYGNGSVSVLNLRESSDPELKALGEFVYRNIFLYYTMKQWEKKPSEISSETTARVPVRLSDDDRYFTDIYQGLPVNGYTEMIKRMLSDGNIDVKAGCEAVFGFESGKIYINGCCTDAGIIYTGELDRLFGYCFGRLDYRTLDFVFETHSVDSYQSHATVNYTVSEDFTRITEFKKMTLQNKPGITTIMKEFSRKYEGKPGEIPYYPVATDGSLALYGKYLEKCREYPQLCLLGRLSEYKYYNMDSVVRRVMDVLGK